MTYWHDTEDVVWWNTEDVIWVSLLTETDEVDAGEEDVSRRRMFLRDDTELMEILGIIVQSGILR